MVTSTLRDIGETNKGALLRIYADKQWISMGYQQCQQTGSGSFSRTLHPMTVAATKPYKSITDHVKMDLGLMVLATKCYERNIYFKGFQVQIRLLVHTPHSFLFILVDTPKYHCIYIYIIYIYAIVLLIRLVIFSLTLP